MPEDALAISRAVARFLAEHRHSPAYRKLVRKWELLKSAAAAELAEGIEYGPAEQQLTRHITMWLAISEASGEVVEDRTMPGFPAPLRCYYCEGATERANRLCLACFNYIRAIWEGKEPDGADRYKRTITPYMRGAHLRRNPCSTATE